MKKKELIELLEKYPDDTNIVLENLEWDDYDFKFHVTDMNVDGMTIIILSILDEDN